MNYVLKYRGSPVKTLKTLAQAKSVMYTEFRKRWPSLIYGQQEAAAHGYTIVGVPELTPEEAREMRVDMDKARYQSIAQSYPIIDREKAS